MRPLIAALEEMRLRLFHIISALEAGDDKGALAELKVAHEEWSSTLSSLRAKDEA